MNYKKMLLNDNFILPLMQKLGLASEVMEVKKIDHHPDYDYSDYRGESSQTYVFTDIQAIPGNFYSVYSAEIFDVKILHYEDVQNIARELGIKNDIDDEDIEPILDMAAALDVGFLDQHGYSTIEQFNLKKIVLTNTKNLERKVELFGSFEGDSFGISQPDWDLYALIKFGGLNTNPNEDKFYRQLLIESFLLRLNGDHRVSFFVAYSGLEGFINKMLNAEKEEERLKDKTKKLFKQYFENLDRHEIYTTVVNDFNGKLTDLRNDVAHGRINELSEENSRHMLLVALILISSVEFCTKTFDELLSPAASGPTTGPAPRKAR